MRTVAVVLAGGAGLRLGGAVPKQFQLLAGKTLLEHSVAAFDLAPGVDDVVVVLPADFVPKGREILGARYAKLRAIIAGGTDRPGSTRAAIDLLSTGPLGASPHETHPHDLGPHDLGPPGIGPHDLGPHDLGPPGIGPHDLGPPGIGPRAGADGGDCNVLFHDAARPLVSQQIIADCVATLTDHEALGVVVPTADTIVELSGGSLVSIPPRESLGRCQTPQGFRLSVIRRAHELAQADPGGYPATDDCGVVLRYLPEVKIHAVQGSEHNLKITFPGDLKIAESYLR